MLLSDFPVLFKADLIFKDFSRKQFFSSLCEPLDILCVFHLSFDDNPCK